jgi:hypothetical protein
MELLLISALIPSSLSLMVQQLLVMLLADR